MAITTLAQALANLKKPSHFLKLPAIAESGELQGTWGSSPNPGGSASDINGSNIVGPVAGAFELSDPASGNNYLSGLEFTTFFDESTNGDDGNQVILYDRLWHNTAIDVTLTTAQTMTTPTWPARDINGSTNGEGCFVLAGITVNIVGAATPTLTISYTNSAGVSGRTGTNIIATTGAPPAGNSWIFSYDTGDTGVRSIESITLSAAWTSGTLTLALCRPLLLCPIEKVNKRIKVGPVDGGFVKLYNGSAPAVIFSHRPSTAATRRAFMATMFVSQG